jgi:hypothetical protein
MSPADHTLAFWLASAGEATVDRVRVTGKATGMGAGTGGLIGDVLNCYAIMRCSADVEVAGEGSVGGLIGTASGATIRLCSSSGTVSGVDTVGGLCGWTYNSLAMNLILSDCHSSASVSLSGNTGGGLIGESADSLVLRTYSNGLVTGTGTDIGGLIGKYTVEKQVIASYWDSQTSGRSTSAAGDARTTAEMRRADTYFGFPFGSIWQISEGLAAPVLANLDAYSRAPQDVHPDDLPGGGTAEDPHLVATGSELYAMRHALDRHYRLVADIDLKEACAWNNGEGWTIPGTFTGSLDGRGHVIRNLVGMRPTQGGQGLFGLADNARIVNLRLESAYVAGSGSVGLLVGTLTGQNGEVRNVQASGGVLATGETAGGLIGVLREASVLTSAADVRVLGLGWYVGGIAGSTDGAVIRMSCAKGGIKGTMYVGGLVGFHKSSNVDNCWSSASVEGEDEVGGLIGRAGDVWYGALGGRSGLPGHVHTSVSMGKVTCGGEYKGGLIGRSMVLEDDGYDSYPEPWMFSIARDCFWDVERSGLTESAAGTPLDTAGIQNRESYPESYDFKRIWSMGSDPGFQHWPMERQSPLAVVPLDSLQGSGTSEDPYLISNGAELNAMRQGLDKTYRLVNDLDLRDSLFWNAGRGWVPVGNSGEPFTGGLDGAGHEIRFLTIGLGAHGGGSESGLFGATSGGWIERLHLTDADVWAADTTGGLIGSAYNTVIHKVSFHGEVFSLSYFVGGLVGSAHGVDFVLGESYTLGSVQGGAIVGGLVGHLGLRDAPLIHDSFSRCTVRADGELGGLVGRVGESLYYESSVGHATRCYSAGRVEVVSTATARGSDELVGGLVGSNVGGTRSSWVGNYWDREVSGQADGFGGTGLSTADMTDPHAPHAYAGWNFENVWVADVDHRLNGGYPYHVGRFSSVWVDYLAGPGGLVTGATSQRITRGGEAQTVEAVAQEGYRFIGWSDGSLDNPRIDTGVNSDLVVTALFERVIVEYTLTYTAGANGSIAGIAQQVVEAGASGTAVLAVANPGYRFVRWSDGSTENPRTDGNVTADVSVSAVFESDNTSYTLLGEWDIVANNHAGKMVILHQDGITFSGTMLGSPLINGLIVGSTVTFTRDITQRQQYTGTIVTEADGSLSMSGTFTQLNLAGTYQWTARKTPTSRQFTLRYAADANGTLSGEAEQVVVEGANGTPVTAVPDAGYRFVEWSDGSTANPRTDTNVSADLSVRAVFAPVVVTHSLKYEAGSNGRVTGVLEQVVEAGTSGTAVTAVPNSGYRFVGWSDGSAANPRTDVNVSADLRVRALFEPAGTAVLRPEIAVQQGKGAKKNLKDNKSTRDFGQVKVKQIEQGNGIHDQEHGHGLAQESEGHAQRQAGQGLQGGEATVEIREAGQEHAVHGGVQTR